VKGVFFDTSVLLGGLIDIGSPSRHAQLVFDAVYDGRLVAPQTAWHCCLEFFAVSTRLPEELRLPPDMALRLLDESIVGRFRVRDLREGARRSFFRRAVQDRVSGGRIYDAHIGEVALSCKAPIVVTENRRHFSSLQRNGVRVLSAVELLADL
jgi:hypothetical protein